jgi:hypothetical protein
MSLCVPPVLTGIFCHCFDIIVFHFLPFVNARFACVHPDATQQFKKGQIKSERSGESARFYLGVVLLFFVTASFIS